jgi:DNA polymerase (family 10)
LIKQNRLTFVKGIGYALAKQIEQLYQTGESSMLNELRAQLPAGIIELSRIPGLSIQKVEKLQEELGIKSVEDLRSACEAGKLREIKGFTAKTEQKILDAIASHETREQFIHIHHAWRISERIIEYLETARGLAKAEAAGETRRWKETVSKIVIVAAAKNPQAIIEHFLQFPLVIRTESKTRSECSVVLSEGFNATLIVVKPEDVRDCVVARDGIGSSFEKASADCDEKEAEYRFRKWQLRAQLCDAREVRTRHL